uniref:Uncharacterized protein n=1 Tax=Steinernema glaseri TaxID=37863 RepID=A0A1I7Z4B4_9BILA
MKASKPPKQTTRTDENPKLASSQPERPRSVLQKRQKSMDWQSARNARLSWRQSARIGRVTGPPSDQSMLRFGLGAVDCNFAARREEENKRDGREVTGKKYPRGHSWPMGVRGQGAEKQRTEAIIPVGIALSARGGVIPWRHSRRRIRCPEAGPRSSSSAPHTSVAVRIAFYCHDAPGRKWPSGPSGTLFGASR